MERLEQGEISRRQAAKDLNIDLAKLKHPLDTRLHQTSGSEPAMLVPVTRCNNGIVYESIIMTY